MSAADHGACLILDRDCFGGLWTAKQWNGELERSSGLVLGCCSGDQGPLVGLICGWVVVDELHITGLGVLPQLRRRGLGRLLLNRLLAWARQQGCLGATLEVAPGNNGALLLYEAAGFVSAGRRKGYYRDGSDALIQWCRLRPEPGAPLGRTRLPPQGRHTGLDQPCRQ